MLATFLRDVTATFLRDVTTTFLHDVTATFLSLTDTYIRTYIMQGCIQGFCQRGANLEYVKKRGGEAVRSCRAAAGGVGVSGNSRGARITQGGANAPPPPLNTPLIMRIDPGLESSLHSQL